MRYCLYCQIFGYKLFKVDNMLVIDSLGKTHTSLVLMEMKHNAISCHHAREQ